jgi:hypothetical protein
MLIIKKKFYFNKQKMIGDLFGEADMFVENKQVQKDTGQNLATYIEKPELPRGESNFVGFFNQYLKALKIEEEHVT